MTALRATRRRVTARRAARPSHLESARSPPPEESAPAPATRGSRSRVPPRQRAARPLPHTPHAHRRRCGACGLALARGEPARRPCHTCEDAHACPRACSSRRGDTQTREQPAVRALDGKQLKARGAALQYSTQLIRMWRQRVSRELPNTTATGRAGGRRFDCRAGASSRRANARPLRQGGHGRWAVVSVRGRRERRRELRGGGRAPRGFDRIEPARA